MTTAQLIIVCGTVVVLALVAAATLLARQGDRAALVELAPEPEGVELEVAGASVVVHTRDGRSIRGTVRDSTPELLSLEGASYLDASGAQAMGGIIAVPRSNVALVQVLLLPPAPTLAEEEGIGTTGSRVG